MQPKLEEAIGYDLAAGAIEVVVMPVFWSGRALRSDFPILLSECQEKFPDIVLSATSAVGEDKLSCRPSSILVPELSNSLSWLTV